MWAAAIFHRRSYPASRKTNSKLVGAPSRNRTGTAEAERFSSHYGFHRQPEAVRALDYALTMARAVGPRRLVSTRSRKTGLRSALPQLFKPGGSPNLTGFTQALSLPGAQI